MLWATMMGHFKLARVLWLKTQMPLRAAVVATRFAMQLVDDANWRSPVMLEELQAGANEIEGWAVGLLDQIEHLEEAVRVPRAHSCSSARVILTAGVPSPVCSADLATHDRARTLTAKQYR